MNVNINEIVNNYYFSLNCREVSYEIFKNIIILLSFLLLTGCTAVQSENESINNEPQAEETIQEIETVSEVEETIQEIKTVSEDNPLSFIQTMDSLDEMRVTFNPNRSGIRLTLPTSEKARVVFFDKKGKVIKAIKYESPQLIDVKDMPQGKYQLYIEYGNAYCIKELDLD